MSVESGGSHDLILAADDIEPPEAVDVLTSLAVFPKTIRAKGLSARLI
jgi:hypothetical protein